MCVDGSRLVLVAWRPLPFRFVRRTYIAPPWDARVANQAKWKQSTPTLNSTAPFRCVTAAPPAEGRGDEREGEREDEKEDGREAEVAGAGERAPVELAGAPTNVLADCEPMALTLDMWEPVGPGVPALKPALVIAHGGGNSGGDNQQHCFQVCAGRRAGHVLTVC